MNGRRTFVRIAAGTLAASAAVLTARGDNRKDKDFTGGWTTEHDSPFGPFREFLAFAEGGGMMETNALLHANSNLDLSPLGQGLPAILNASDGVGSWERIGPREIRTAFRKLLFGEERQHLGDFVVAGTLKIRGSALEANWYQIQIVDKSGNLLADLGQAKATGTRIE